MNINKNTGFVPVLAVIFISIALVASVYILKTQNSVSINGERMPSVRTQPIPSDEDGNVSEEKLGQLLPTASFLPTIQPTPSPKPEIEIKDYTYINNNKGFSFKFSNSLVVSSSSTKDFVQFLEKQEGVGLASRMSMFVYENPQNLTLDQIVKDKEVLRGDTYGLSFEKTKISGNDGLKLTKVISQNEMCNGVGDGGQKNRIFHLLIKGDGFVVHFIPNNSCESLSRDWFDITPATFTLNK